MTSLTADHTTLLKNVQGFAEPVEILDSDGRLLGLFVPARVGRSGDVDWQEIERQATASEPSYPFEDVLARLHRLEKEVERRKAAGETELSTNEGVEFIDRLRAENQPTT